ncbi:MAG: barstar family protein [Bacteroidales bacterium]|nr:barstar family protein [Bacteroidales bacterium]MBR2887897.1 barstar family protein [Bacteroidales bacterium]
MKKITLDFENISNKEEMHKYLAEKFEFPDYYGKNLDALFECLTDIAEPTAVNIINAINDYDEQIINVITSAEEENDNLAVFVN